MLIPAVMRATVNSMVKPVICHNLNGLKQFGNCFIIPG